MLRSLITLKALTHDATGGIVAAATTSLPEQLGGPKWDYRFCWLRDSTFTLYALMQADSWTRQKRGGDDSFARLPEVRTKCRFCTELRVNGD